MRNKTFTVHALIDAVRQGPYTSLGCYPVFFVTADGCALSYEAVRKNLMLCARATRDPGTDKQWEIVGHDVNWEDPSRYCDHTSQRIESAYAEDEAAHLDLHGNLNGFNDFNT